MKTKYTLLVMLVVLSMVITACGAGGAASPKEPSVARIGWTSGPDSLNIGVAAGNDIRH